MQNKAAPFNYIWQLSLILIFVIATMYFFKGASQSGQLWTLGLSSLSSSAFIIFTRPNAYDVHESRFILSYSINILIGAGAHFLIEELLTWHHFHSESTAFFAFSVITAMAVASALVLMVLFRVKHPPAIGMCLIMIIDLQQYDVVFITIGGVLALTVLRYMLSPWLRDL